MNLWNIKSVNKHSLFVSPCIRVLEKQNSILLLGHGMLQFSFGFMALYIC